MLRYQMCETKTFSRENADETRTNLSRVLAVDIEHRLDLKIESSH